MCCHALYTQTSISLFHNWTTHYDIYVLRYIQMKNHAVELGLILDLMVEFNLLLKNN